MHQDSVMERLYGVDRKAGDSVYPSKIDPSVVLPIAMS